MIRIAFRFAQAFVAGAVALAAVPAAAQTVTRYTNTTDSATNGLNESATSCTSPLVRNFTVSTNYTVTDVDIGVLAAHTYRGDLVMRLFAPDNSSVTLTNGAGANAANFNVLFDDSASSNISTHTANDIATSTTVVPTYQRTFRPSSSLSTFNGKSSLGTWRLEICDQYGGDSGTFYQTDLFLTSAATNYADLSLTKTVSNTAPTFGSTITYTLTARNASGSPQTATGIVVTDLLPAGVTFASSSGAGTYNSGTGAWAVGTLAPGANATRTIVATVAATSGATVTNTAEVTASSHTDIDSTPNNGVTSEDDYAAASFTVAGTRVAGTPPTVTCPSGEIIFDWNTTSWPAGSTSRTYAFGTFGNISFNITNPGTWYTDASLGGQSPTNQNVIHGGFGTGENTLAQIVNLPSRTSEAVSTITLPTAMSKAQFRIFDVDYNAGQFADRVLVIGYNGSSPVIPVLTNGVSNYVIGNEAFGDGASADAEALGNVVVTFQSAIDKIEIHYGDHSLAPTNPGIQGIALHDIKFCYPVTTMNVTKVSSIISDPVNGTTNPKAVPGALVEYIFAVSNPNAVSAQTVILTDLQPGDLTMCVASIGASGPVVFTDGSPASGLTYTYTSLASMTDSLEFTNNNGTTWTYVPTPGADGCDVAIQGFRLKPTGTLAASRGFSARARFKLK